MEEEERPAGGIEAQSTKQLDLRHLGNERFLIENNLLWIAFIRQLGTAEYTHHKG